MLSLVRGGHASLKVSHREIRKGIEAGAEDFMSKPIDKGEVLARDRMLLKMKTLKDRLNHAYEEIDTVMTFAVVLPVERREG